MGIEEELKKPIEYLTNNQRKTRNSSTIAKGGIGIGLDNQWEARDSLTKAGEGMEIGEDNQGKARDSSTIAKGGIGIGKDNQWKARDSLTKAGDGMEERIGAKVGDKMSPKALTGSWYDDRIVNWTGET